MQFTSEEEISFSGAVFSLKSRVMKTRSRRWALILICLGIFFGACSLRAQSVNVSASPTVITNQGDESTITFTVFPPASRTLALNYNLTGTAALGADYALLGEFTRSGQIIIPAGQITTTITLHAFYDEDPFASEFVVLTLLHGKRYSVGSPSRARIDIENVKDH